MVDPKAIYKLYSANPPKRFNGSLNAAYWLGRRGQANRYVKTSLCYGAWKAGREAFKN